jgi:hypothetical protein
MADILGSSHVRPGIFARLIRAVIRVVDQSGSRSGTYRPEKHYMRGTGPKSRRPGPGDEGTPKAS